VEYPFDIVFIGMPLNELSYLLLEIFQGHVVLYIPGAQFFYESCLYICLIMYLSLYFLVILSDVHEYVRESRQGMDNYYI
jgi:hypothetical protein